MVGLSDSELDASVEPGPGASIKVIGLFSEATVRVPAGFRVKEGGLSLFGDRDLGVPTGDAGEIRIDAYGLCCDLNVVEIPVEPGTSAQGG